MSQSNLMRDLKEVLGTNRIRKLDQSSTEGISNCHIKIRKTVEPSKEAKKDPEYTKRPGTTQISGQLYETKLLTLVLLRAHEAHQDKKIANFFLGTNLDGLGALDDLIFSYEMKGRRKMLFVQAKHRDDPSKKKITWNDICSEEGDFSIFKYFESYLEIISKFDGTNPNPIFRAEVENVEMNLIVYTPAEVEIGEEEKKSLLPGTDDNEFLKTSDKGKIFQINLDCLNSDKIESLVELAYKHQPKQLAAKLAKFIFSGENMYEGMMKDYMIKIYHVVLAKDVIDVTKRPQADYAEGKIRSDFHECEGDFTKILRRELYEAAIASRKAETSNLDTVEELLRKLSIYPSSENISQLLLLVGSILKFEKNGKLTVEDEAKGNVNSEMRKSIANLQVKPHVRNQAVNKAGKKILNSITFKLPLNFGNRNFQVTDETNQLAKELEIKLENYRFNIKIKSFPVDSFQSAKNVFCKDLIRDFLSKFKFYVSQPKEDAVEKITKNELGNCQVFSSNQNLPIENEVIYTVLHEKIQKWWKQPSSYYLTENSEILNATRNSIVLRPYLFVSNSFYLSKVKYVDIKFNEESVETLNLEVREFIRDSSQQYLNIVTNVRELTAIKLLQYFEKGVTRNDYYFIDFDYVLKRAWFIIIINEISKEEGILLVVDCGNQRDIGILNGLKKVIFLTCYESKKMSEYKVFENYREIEDAKIDFLSLNSDSQNKLLKESKVIFQGRKLPLGSVVDDYAKSFISGDILLKLLNKDPVEVDKEVANLDADIEPFYMRKSILLRPYLCVSSSFYLSKVKYVDIKFNEESVETLNLEVCKFIRDSNQQYLNIVTNVRELTAIKLLQYFAKEETQNDYYFIDFDYVLTRGWFLDIIREINANKGTILVVDCENQRIICTLSALNKVILLSSNESRIFENYPEIEDLTIDFLSLDTNSQNKLLKESKVIFQGRELPLDDIVDDHAKRFISGEILFKLLKRDRVKIGKKVANLDANIEPYYITRQFVSDRGSSDLIPEDQFISDFLLNDKLNAIVISAEPGMGKSTVLTHMALLIKQRGAHPLLWLVRINLNDFIRLINDLQFSNVMNTEDLKTQINWVTVRRFLLEKLNFETRFEEQLFKFNLEGKGKFQIVLFIDEFDEISSNYKPQTCQLLQILNESCKLIVTIRENSSVDELKKKNINVNVFELCGFGKLDQIKYLQIFWKPFQAEKFISLLQFRMGLEYLSYPLHLKIIGEYFKDDLKEFDLSTNITNMQKLYKKMHIMKKNEIQYSKISMNKIFKISDRLYETKLLTLVLLRAHKAHEDKKIANFFSGTNLDGVGAFYDLILSYEMEGKRKMLFVQAKHRDEPSKRKITWNDICSEKGDSILKYFYSYLQIISKFDGTNPNPIFRTEVENVEMNLIVYTPAEVEIGEEEEKFLEKLETDQNEFLKTSDEGKIFQINFNRLSHDKILNRLVELAFEHQMKQLAAKLAKFIFSKKNLYESMMEDYMIKIYHIALAENVIDVTKWPEGDYAEGKIRSDFHKREGDFIKVLRKELYEAAVDSRKAETSNLDTVEQLLRKILDDPNSENISDLLGSTLKFEKNGKLTVVNEAKAMIKTDLQKAIANLKINSDLRNKAVNKAGWEIVSSVTLKLPINFGNRDFQATNEIAQLAVKLAESFQSGKDDLCKNLIRDFLAKFKFYTSQSKQSEVEDLTKNELRNCQVFSSNLQFPIENENIYTVLHEKIHNWWKQPNGYYLTENSEILNDMRKSIVLHPYLYVSSSFYLSKVKYVDIKFNEESVETLSLEVCKFIRDSNQQYLNILTSLGKLTAIKLLQYFEKVETQNDYYFIDFDYVLKRGWFWGIMNEIGTIEGITLIVDCGNLRDISILSGLKKVIFLTCKESKKMSEYEIFKNYREFEDIKIDFPNLNSNSKNKLLKESKVIFQGRELPLGNVVDDDAKSFINGEILFKLLNRDRVEIGKEVANLDADIEPYYIEREFKLGKSLAINDDNASSSSDEVKILEGQFINDFVHDDEDSVIVISAEPGMGKSTVLTHMALLFNEERSSPLFWPVRINLNDHTKSLRDLKFSVRGNDPDDIQNASDFLLKTLNFKTEFETKLFQRYLRPNSKVNVILFIDGFDEISPNYGPQAQRLLEIIKNAKVAKILVASRPYSFVDELKTKLNARLFELEGLRKWDQLNYLEWFWKGTLENEQLHEEHTEKFILGKQLGDNFLDNPLHLRLVAEYYKDEFERFCTSTDDDKYEADFKNKINRITLHEKIIERKYYEIFVVEKKRVDRSNVTVQSAEKEILFPKFVEEHKILALHSLFNERDFWKIASREINQQKLEELLKQFRSGERKAGIISTVIDGRAEFIHKTFAEYFAGIYFANKLELTPLKDLEPDDFYVLLDDQYDGISKFFFEAVRESEPSSDMKAKFVHLLRHPSREIIIGDVVKRSIFKSREFFFKFACFLENHFQLNGSEYFQKVFRNFDDNGKFVLLAFAHANQRKQFLEFLLKEIDMGVILRVFNRDPNALQKSIKLHDMNDIFSSSSLEYRIWKKLLFEYSDFYVYLKVGGWVVSLMEFLKCRRINFDYESAWNIITKHFLKDVHTNWCGYEEEPVRMPMEFKWEWMIYYKDLLIRNLDLNKLENLWIHPDNAEHLVTSLPIWELIENDSELSKENDLREVFFKCRDLFDHLKNKLNENFITLFNELKPNYLGVVINVRDKNGAALIDRAVELRNEEIINLLKDSGAKCNFECSGILRKFFQISEDFRKNYMVRVYG